MKFNILIISLLCLLSVFTGHSLYAQEDRVKSGTSSGGIKEEINGYINQAEELPYSDPQKAIALANKVIAYAHKWGDNELLARAELVNGYAYVNYGDFVTGFEYVVSAKNNCPDNNKLLCGKIMAKLSSLYIYLRDLNRAFEYANKALEISRQQNDSVMIAHCYNTLGLINIYVPDNEMAERNFHKALEINRKTGNKRGIVRNLNNLALYRSGNTSLKIEQLYEAIEINKGFDANWSLAENYNNLGMQYYYKGDMERALSALSQAREYAEKINARELILDNNRYFTEVYSSGGKYKEAYLYLKSVLEEIEREKMAEQIRIYEAGLLQKRLDNTKQSIRDKEQEYQLVKMKYAILIIVLLFFTITLVAVYFGYRYRHKRKIQILEARNALESQEREIALREKELVTLKLEQKEAEARNAERELKHIKDELTNTAFFVRTREEMLTNIQLRIRETYKLPEDEKLEKLHAISRTISRMNTRNNEMEILMDKVSSDFVYKLSEKYPELTGNEKRLASLLRIGLSSKEIASIISSQPKTVDMARYRLRKKMELDSDEKLQECLGKI